MKNYKNLLIAGIFMLIFTTANHRSYAHCEIPCGIFEDTVRVELIKEHITTIEKSMKMIIELSNEESPDYNQIVRWVINKEDHANKIQKIVSQYFLHQRIKPVEPENEELYEKYIERLTLLHDLSIYAMKAKQTTDLSYIKKLSRAIHDFEHAYFHTHDHDHGHKH